MVSTRLPGDVKEVSISGLFSRPLYLLINIYQARYFLMKEKPLFSKLGPFGIFATYTLFPLAGGLQTVFLCWNGGVKGAVTPVGASALVCSD